MEVALGYFEDDSENNASDVDMNRPPISGIEYLKRVQIEAATCPDVVIAKETPTVQQNVFVDEITTQTLDDGKAFPGEQAQLRSAEEFAYLRQTFYRWRANPQKCGMTKNVQLPARKTNQLWCRFCLGADFNSRFLAESMNGVDKMPVTNVGAQGQGNAPLLSILVKLTQTMTIKLLTFHLNWLNTLGFSYDQGCWLFSLLLCLDKPTDSDTTSKLRELCRRVISIRNSLTPSEENNSLLHQLNLLVVIITRFFGQSDLAMHYF